MEASIPIKKQGHIMRARNFDFQIIDLHDKEFNKGELGPSDDWVLRAISGEPGKEIEVSVQIKDFEHHLFPYMLMEMGKALMKRTDIANAKPVELK